MKKRILFMVINMNVGGTEKALLNMIDTMSEDKYDITLLMLEKYGGFLNAIPKRVNVEYLDSYSKIKDILNDPPKTVVLKLLKNRRFFKAIHFIFLFILSAIYKERSILFNSLLCNEEFTQNEYDVAIAYAGPMDFISFFIAKKVKAKKKFQWIHFDVGKIYFNIYFASKMYPLFDKIFVVSDQAKEKLIELLPSIKDKTEKFHNIVDPSQVKKLADEGVGFSDNFNGIRILTVGRLSKEKGQDLTIPVLAKLKEEGFNVRWYCIGDGAARKEYEELIMKYGLENDYFLLGLNPNPYPFMSQCDIYVQPSRHEGYCITLAEARCFNKPIICTDFTGAQEQLNHIQNGKIVNFSETALLKEISNEIQELKKNRVSNAESFATIK